MKESEDTLKKMVTSIGNPIAADVPISKNEDDNAIYSTWGVPTTL